MLTQSLTGFLRTIGLMRRQDIGLLNHQNLIQVFLIGAMKCGTNSLYHNLKNHPQIVIPATKELDFFLHDQDPKKYLRKFSNQLKKLPSHSGALATLDGTTQYSKHPAIPLSAAKIARAFPKARIIYNMRDPISRLESQIAHHIARNEKISLDNWREHNMFSRALDLSRYYLQISQYAVEFPRSQIFLGIFENMIENQIGFAKRACEFIGVDPDLCEVKAHQRNKRREANQADKLSFTAEQDREFALLLKDDIDCLVEAFGVDTTKWTRYHAALST